MWKDPIVEEIHKVREKILKDCKDKGESFEEHILKVQKKHKGKLVRRKPKLLLNRAAS